MGTVIHSPQSSPLGLQHHSLDQSSPRAVALQHHNLDLNQTITVYVQHETTGLSTSVHLPLKSTLLQLKIATFDQLSLGDAVAALNPRVGFTFDGIPLDNESTIHSSQISNGDRLFIVERHTPGSSRRGSRSSSSASSPTGQHHSMISDIWGNNDLTSDELTLPTCLLCEDDQPPASSLTNKQQSSAKLNKKYQVELDRMKSSYRTKMCRTGVHACKYG